MAFVERITKTLQSCDLLKLSKRRLTARYTEVNQSGCEPLNLEKRVFWGI